MTGHHETAHIGAFNYGVAHRGASIRIPRQIAKGIIAILAIIIAMFLMAQMGVVIWRTGAHLVTAILIWSRKASSEQLFLTGIILTCQS